MSNKLLWMLLIVVLSVSTGIAAAQEGDTPPPPDQTWTVTSVQETDLTSGVMNNALSLSPDGKRIAHVTPASFCIYTSNMDLEHCIEGTDELRIRLESLHWSPDSRYLTFSQNFFVYFVHSNIWLVDVFAGTLTALTPPYEGSLPFNADDWPAVDVLPRWTSDGLYFARILRSGGTYQPTMVYRFDQPDSDPVPVAPLPDINFAPFEIDFSADLTAFNIMSPAEPEEIGLWTMSLDTGEARVLVQTEPVAVPISITFSPDGSQLLVVDGRAFAYAFPDQTDPENSEARIVDTDTGEVRLIDPQRFVRHGGWNPDGSAFAYIVYSTPEAADNGLYITHSAGVPGELVLSGDFYPLSRQGTQSLTWGANNRLLLGEYGAWMGVVVQLAQR